MTSIKVSRTKLITELEAAKARLLDEAKQTAKEWEDYDKATTAWVAEALKKAKPSQAKQSSYGNRIEVDVPESFPRPKQPNNSRPSERRYYTDFNKRGEYTSLNEVINRKVTEIDNTLKLLAMSNEESVPATAYRSVAQYL